LNSSTSLRRRLSEGARTRQAILNGTDPLFFCKSLTFLIVQSRRRLAAPRPEQAFAGVEGCFQKATLDRELKRSGFKNQNKGDQTIDSRFRSEMICFLEVCDAEEAVTRWPD
jgi:hypothetical protein